MQIPPDLRPVLPWYFHDLGNRRIMIPLTLVCVGPVAYLCGTYANGWVRLLPALFGPFFAGLYLTLRPWNPYKNAFMSESNYPAANAKAQLLIALFATSGARKTIWKGVAALIFAFLSIVLFGSLVAGPARFWELWDDDIAVLIFAFAGVSLALFITASCDGRSGNGRRKGSPETDRLERARRHIPLMCAKTDWRSHQPVSFLNDRECGDLREIVLQASRCGRSCNGCR